MTRLPLPGFWYGEACYRPDGSHGYWASPIVGNFTQTEVRQIPTDPLGFTRGTPFGRFAGQSRLGLTGNKEYKESDGSGHIVGPSPVENPVLYLRDGTLVQGQTSQGADGLRYQADDGSIVTSDQTHVSPDGLLANYTELHNIRIGSDQIAGLGAIVQLLNHPGGTGPRYILEPGNCTTIRFTFTEPNKLAVYVVKLQESAAVAFWLTVDEIPLLTPYPAPPVTIGPLGPSRPSDGRLYDMAPFIHCDPALAARSGPDQENVQIETIDGVIPFAAGNIILYGKFGQVGSYEMYATDTNWFYSLEDASGPDESQSWTDPRWFPMHMQIGEAHAFVTGPHEAIYKNRHTRQELRRVPFNRKMWLHALWDEYQWGLDLGIRPTRMAVYDPTAGIYAKDRIIEVRYEAWRVGWLRWEAHRSDIVYAHGAAEFTDASRVQRVDFYRLGGSRVQPKLTGCVPAVVPHLPPLAPPEPPGGFHPPIVYSPGGSMLQEKGGILGVGGKFGRFGPEGTGLFGRRGVIWDGDPAKGPVGDYEFTLTETTPGRGQAADTKNGSTLGADLTQYSTDETHQFYGSFKADTPGEYETPFLYIETDQAVKTLVFRFPQGSDRPHPYVTSLTWVTQ